MIHELVERTTDERLHYFPIMENPPASHRLLEDAIGLVPVATRRLLDPDANAGSSTRKVRPRANGISKLPG
jgi:hypothetical protein